MGFTSLVVKLDALVVASFLNESLKINLVLKSLVDNCRCLSSTASPRRKILPVFRKANKNVDALAWLAHEQSEDFIYFQALLGRSRAMSILICMNYDACSILLLFLFGNL